MFDNCRASRFSGRRRSIQGREFPRTPIFESRKRRKTLYYFFVCSWGNLPGTGPFNRDHFMAGHKPWFPPIFDVSEEPFLNRIYP